MFGISVNTCFETLFTNLCTNYFGNFFATARQENGVSITSNQIIADDLTGDKVKDEYIRVTSNVVQAPKPKIIT